MAKKQGKSNMIGDVTVYSKKKQKDELLKLQSNMNKYVAYMNKYKVDSSQWAKANKLYQDSTYAYNKGLSDIKAGKIYELDNFHADSFSKDDPRRGMIDIKEMGESDLAEYLSGNAKNNEDIVQANSWDGRTGVFEASFDTSRQESSAQEDTYIRGMAPEGYLYNSNAGLNYLYKKPTNKPTQPKRPDKDFPSDVNYDNTYEGLRMRPWWASAAMQDSTQNIGTLNPLDTGFKDGFNMQDAQSFPQEIKDQYNIDYMQDKMRNNQYANGGYISSYGYGGQMLPQYGMGSWMNQNSYQQQAGYGQQQQPTYSQQQVPQYDSGTNSMGTKMGIGAVSAVNPIIGGIAGLGESMVSPLEQNMKSINQDTGQYDNINQAIGSDVLRSTFDPFTAGTRAMQDKDASGLEKVAAFTGLGGLFSKKRAKRQEANNVSSLNEANAANAEAEALRQEQFDEYNASMKRNATMSQRLGSMEQQSQYNTSFAANGGFIKSYANGGDLFDSNRNNPQPYKTSDGSDYYVMKYNEAFANNPDIKDFQEGYSYTTNKDTAYKYGSISPKYDLKNSNISFPSTYDGNTDQFRKAFSNGYSTEDLQGLPMSNPRRSKADGGFMDGVDKNPNVTYFGTGGSHEKNPLGGIPVGQNAQVEEREFKVKLKDGDYIFSDRF